MKPLLFIVLIFNFYLQSMEEYFINHDGNSRSYLKYIPDNLNLTSSTNLFIGIHGYTGTASGFEKETTGGFNDMADKYNFIATNQSHDKKAGSNENKKAFEAK